MVAPSREGTPACPSSCLCVCRGLFSLLCSFFFILFFFTLSPSKYVRVSCLHVPRGAAGATYRSRGRHTSFVLSFVTKSIPNDTVIEEKASGTGILYVCIYTPRVVPVYDEQSSSTVLRSRGCARLVRPWRKFSPFSGDLPSGRPACQHHTKSK